MDKPTLDVTTLDDHKVVKKRQKAWKKMMKTVLAIPKDDRKKIASVLHKWRKKQRKLLESDNIEDPHPFENNYVFYCLDDGCGVDM